LVAGALVTATLASIYAMFILEIDVGSGTPPRWVVRPEYFTRIFPVSMAACLIMFVVAGPLLYGILKVTGILAAWSVALGGGLMVLLVLTLFNREFSLQVHGVHFVLGALGFVISYALYKRLGSVRRSVK
jgi:hypothetical protein